MARRDAILKLHQTLVAQRNELMKQLAGETTSLGEELGPADSGDLAHYDTEQEMHSQLAALESRELRRIEKAIAAIQAGNYGTCEYCQKSIPVQRLRALPHTTNCVACQREHEDQLLADGGEADWESAYEYQARENDRELTPRDVKLEVDF